MEGGKIVAVAWAVRAIALYPPPGEERAARAAIQRARDWLEAQDPPTPEQGVFQLLGLVWAGAQPAELSAPVARLLHQQRPDGGWASLQTLDSDAWATGTALVALHRAGVGATHAAYRRGVDFLLRTQFEDGSWWVRSRTWPFQPHFDGQFPHGKDQWISAGGTGWATIALLLTLDPQSPAPTLASAQGLIAKFGATTASRPGSADTRAAATLVGDSSAAETPAVMARADSPVISFNRQIRPILDRSCGGCHGGEKVKGDFRLTSRETLLKGGQSGEPAVVPGRGAESRLLAYVADQVEDLEMPPLNRREKYPQLTADEIALLRAWIDAGAAWEQSAAANGTGL